MFFHLGSIITYLEMLVGKGKFQINFLVLLVVTLPFIAILEE